MERAARAMAAAMRVVGDNENDGDYGKGNDNGNKGVRQGTAMAMRRALVTATRVAGNE
jgi:hypothetical protein